MKRRLITGAVAAGAVAALSVPALAEGPASACIGQVTIAVAGNTVVDQHDICVPPTS